MHSNLETPQWLELIGSSSSLFFNMILLFIINRFSRPEYGSYKILMLVMTSLYVIYSAIEVLVLPSYYIYEYNYFLFTTSLIQYQGISQVLIVTFCSVFECMQVVLAAQFIYRFLSVGNNHFLRDRYFKGRRHIVWVSATVIFYLNWYTVAWFVFGNRGDHPKELDEAVEQRYGRNVSSMAFTLVTYAEKDTTGNIKMNWIDITMILYLIVCATVLMFISLLCGVKTWMKIQHTMSLAQKSQRLQKQERQLFFALLTQFIIPFLGNTLPMLVVFVCPALHVSPEPYTNYICMLVPFYPTIDAFATTLIIKDYYRGVMNMFGATKYIQKSSTMNNGRVPPNSIHAKTLSNIELSQIDVARPEMTF